MGEAEAERGTRCEACPRAGGSALGATCWAFGGWALGGWAFGGWELGGCRDGARSRLEVEAECCEPSLRGAEGSAEGSADCSEGSALASARDLGGIEFN